MIKTRNNSLTRFLLFSLFWCAWLQFAVAAPDKNQFNIRDYGAVGDGKHLDSPAINKAIDAAVAVGGGTVILPAGKYLSGSIRMQNNISLRIEKGAVIVADKWNSEAYDPTEPFTPPAYQDGGHTFFHNSLIWGENLTNVSITGEGLIDGSGLTSFQGRLNEKTGFVKGSEGQAAAAPENPMLPTHAANKAIALKLCKNVIIRDITIFKGGWFAILVTGCDDMTIENVTIDTNRDGMDIDCCRNVMVKNCRVNSPEDDAICPKSTYALGYQRLTENLTIVDCQVSGYEVGTLLDGSLKPCQRKNGQGGNGRIKFGTESSGGFRNCVVSNCVFRSCMGFALEEVDGGILENITANHLTMTNVTHYALYIVTGKRNRTPNLTTNSRMRNIQISDVTADGVGRMSGIQIFGLPEQPLEGIRLKNISITSKGGGTKQDAARNPKELGTQYPDPAGKGNMPAYGVFARHVKGLELTNITLNFQTEDLRPAAKFADIDGLKIDNLKAQVVEGVRVAEFAADVTGVSIHNSPGLEKLK